MTAPTLERPVESPTRTWRERLLGGAPLVPLAILFGLNAVDEFDRTAFGILAPEIQDHFGVGAGATASIAALAVAVRFTAQTFVGYLADRRPRVRVAVAGAGAWGVCSLLTGLAPTLVVLALIRMGSGLGGSVVEPTHNSLIADYYEPTVRVRAYYFHRIANNLGMILGPALAGALAYAFGWRAPFVLFAVPTGVLVLVALAKLREPVRGAHERRLAGGSEESAALEEEPPSFSEAWRICYHVRALRRTWFSLPFFAASVGGLAVILANYYEDVFGLNEAQRGALFAGVEVFQIVGAILGVRFVSRLIARDPGLVLKLLGMAGALVAGAFIGVAAAPTLGVAIFFHGLASAATAPLVAGIFFIASLVIPPRARAMGFGIGGLWVVLGSPMIAIVGGLGESIGFRGGVAAMAPIFAVGAIILASGGRFVSGDIDRVRASALAQAETRRSRLAGDPKLLVVRDLDVAYGQVQVLFGVNFHVSDGEIVALLGTNGAGKSTLLATISGLVEPTGGAIVFDGRDITMRPANETAADGIVMVPGGRGVFPTLTVEENLELAGWLYQKDREYLDAAVTQVLEYFPILRERWHLKAGNLSGGEQQMLTLAQAFIAKPKLLMIDELSLGLAPLIIEQLLDIVRAIHDGGTTVILVEQSVNIAVTLAERTIFMEKGEIRFEGPTIDLLDRADILRAVFLGGGARGVEADGRAGVRRVRARERAARAPCDACARGAPTALQVRQLSVSFGGVRAVDEVDLAVREGEILGVIGPNGAGKTTVFDAVSGFVEPLGGRVLLGDTDITGLSPDARAVVGLGRSFQDARLFPALTVADNLAVALERHIPTRDPLAAALVSPATRMSERWVAERVEELVDLMHLDAFANKFVAELSTGTRRVIDLACALAHGPSVLLLDEPSSGIAQRETEALAPRLLEIRDRTGAGLMVIEHDIPLVTSVADHLVALDLGRVIAEGDPDDVVRDERVVESYLGEAEEAIRRSGTLARGAARSGARSGGRGARRRGAAARRRRSPR